jgi:hypothetical protein
MGDKLLKDRGCLLLAVCPRNPLDDNRLTGSAINPPRLVDKKYRDSPQRYKLIPPRWLRIVLSTYCPTAGADRTRTFSGADENLKRALDHPHLLVNKPLESVKLLK